ncbi:MAG: hypothetical protein FWH46_03305 [Methanimicrococcus sp.]|nr:hypothetical protein [Methanimicrococcus sp.]
MDLSIPILFVAGAVFLALVGLLQVYLSKRHDRTGYVLPALTLITSLLAVLGLYFYSAPPNLISFLFQALQIFILINILTVILFSIYVAYNRVDGK